MFQLVQIILKLKMVQFRKGRNQVLVSSILVTSLMVLGIFAILPFAIANAQSSSDIGQLTIFAEDRNGNALTGYYTELSQSSTIVAARFTPASFTLSVGQTYTVQVDSYGSCHFSYWSDTGSTINYRSITLRGPTFPGSALELWAVYNCGNPSPNIKLGVASSNVNSQELLGYYLVLYQNDRVMDTGFTVASFPVISGDTYSIRADNYGNYCFAFWDTSSGTSFSNPVTFTASAPSSSPGQMVMQVVYGGCAGATSGTSQLTITSQDTSGNTLNGFYTVLNHSGSVVATGFTPHAFTINNGQVYRIQADSYRSCSFKYWLDNHNTQYYRSIDIASDTQYTAVYSCA